MLGSTKQWMGRVQFLCLGLILCLPLCAQQQDQTPRSVREQGASNYRTQEPSDLAQENLNRVAASAAQIRAVLAKDEGLLVELKRWVAKEATDNGQVIDDANLTDQAIFDRLEQDVVFRSVATRLLQRYGYLMPAANPDSDVAKEKELVLKERARRLVQIESQEDTDSLRPQGSREELEETASCDPRTQEDCPQQSPTGRGQRTRSPGSAPLRERNPNSQEAPEQLPQQSSPRLIQADGLPELPDLKDGSNSSAAYQLASNPISRNTNPLNGAPSLGGSAVDGLLLPQSLLALDRERTAPDETSTRTNEMARVKRTGPYRGRGTEEEDVTPVKMSHRANPYADIPSLYDMYVQASVRQRPTERFGLDVFRNTANDPEELPMDLPVGPDYVVGPGDSLEIDMWGAVSQRLFRVVDREGRVSLPEAGPLLVSGRNLSDVQQTVQQTLRTQFRDVSADVSVSKLRTVRVYVVGEVGQPGAYDISSLSTPLNALFVAGGITPRGSLRALKHLRGKQLVEEVDAYDLLLHGVRSDLRRLENGDTLLVPPLGPQVTVDGMVRRPAIYELNGEKSLADVLGLAGGILPTATLRHIEVQRVEAHEKRTMLTLNLSPSGDSDDVKKQLDSFAIHDGDEVHIFPIAPYNEDAIYVQGHVLRPGRYSYKSGMKLSDLIGSYKDLLPEPAPHYAEIVRLNAPDFRPSVESFDLSAALANPASAPGLQPLDTVRIFSRYDFEPAPEIWVGGEVRVPGKYRTSGQVRLKDAVFLAGGVTQDALLDSAQLFRTEPDGTLKILSVNLARGLAGNSRDNILLEPRDRLIVHRSAAKVDPPTVYVKGEVDKPGRYPLTTNMHVEDLVRVAGGLKKSADTDTADLTSYAESHSAKPVAQNLNIKLSAAMQGDASADLPLHDGDVLTIRQSPGWNDIGAMITLKGEVQHPGTYGIRPGERLSSILARAGGFNAQAYPYGAVLMRRDVRELEMQSRMELVQRVKAEQVSLKSLPESDADQKNAKLTAIAETETTLQQLQVNPPIGRVVIHVQPNPKEWQNTPKDIAVRDGDVLFVPKKAGYVMVNGQVFNATAIGFQSGRSAKWYLSQAGGLTPLADRKGVFVIRADGSVIAAKNNSSGWWSGDPLSAALKPGDTVVVPEKAPKIGGRNWATVMQAAQMASSIALTVAYIHP
ncbi:MAG TPA: SLBB domain-containing protein [Candidatus Acidoferrum sp.]|nr:SLBB domain-containing protein [Candidatus Acidoferrum sp.]